MEVKLEDDVFFADLSKQISLLIMDDEEDSSVSHITTSVSLQELSQGIIHSRMQTSIFLQEQHYGKRESKGTGVFIPQLLNRRKKNNNKHGKHGSSSNNSKFNAQFDNSSRGLLQHVPFNNNMNSSYDCFNSRRF